MGLCLCGRLVAKRARFQLCEDCKVKRLGSDKGEESGGTDSVICLSPIVRTARELFRPSVGCRRSSIGEGILAA